MPEHLAAYVASWTRVHPAWEHKVWTEADLTWLRNQELFDGAGTHTPSVGQFRSDVARYEILHRHGGVYVDCDFEALAPLDELLLDVDCFAAWETDDRWVGNAILGAVAGHPFFEELIAGLPRNVRRNRGKRPTVLSGPQYLTPVALRHAVTLFPSSMMYPYRYDDVGTGRDLGPFPGAYAVHAWENTRTGSRARRVRP